MEGVRQEGRHRLVSEPWRVVALGEREDSMTKDRCAVACSTAPLTVDQTAQMGSAIERSGSYALRIKVPSTAE